MNEVEQVEDNLKTFEEYKPLSDEERDTLFAIAEALKQGVPCTGCRYCCKGCPMELDIPMLIECYNNFKTGAGMNISVRIDGLDDDKKPSACIGCGQCSHACPQGIDVPAVMVELNDLYVKGPKWADTVKTRDKIIREELKGK